MNIPLKIKSWNANHQQELQAILDINKIGVYQSEKHFTKQSFIEFRDCKVLHTINLVNAAKGGNAVTIKEKNLHHEKLNSNEQTFRSQRKYC